MALCCPSRLPSLIVAPSPLPLTAFRGRPTTGNSSAMGSHDFNDHPLRGETFPHFMEHGLSTLDLASITYFPRQTLNSSPHQHPGQHNTMNADAPPDAQRRRSRIGTRKGRRISSAACDLCRARKLQVSWDDRAFECLPPLVLTDFVTRSAPSNRTLRAATAAFGPPRRAHLISNDGRAVLQIGEFCDVFLFLSPLLFSCVLFKPSTPFSSSSPQIVSFLSGYPFSSFLFIIYLISPKNQYTASYTP